MAYIYELGYGTCEESASSQLTHRRKFSQKRFEQMILACTVEAARLERDLHFKKWNEDWSARHDYEKREDDVADTEPIMSRRHYELKSAMEYRLKGMENLYHHNINDAVNIETPRLTYQELHPLVVDLMCKNHGFKPIEKLRRVYFFGWSNLAVHNDWDSYDSPGSITKRATRLVRKLVFKAKDRWSRGSAETKWSAARDKALRKAPDVCDSQDEALCKELGVTFVPYNLPDAVKAREEQPKEDYGFGAVEEELLGAFGEVTD